VAIALLVGTLYISIVLVAPINAHVFDVPYC